MGWDCERSGCFNKKKRLVFEPWSRGLVRNLGFTDIDGEHECNGHYLRLEHKDDGKDLTVGQRIAFERLPSQFVTVFFTGEPDGSRVSCASTLHMGVEKPLYIKNSNDFNDWCRTVFNKWAIGVRGVNL
jgi:hypothetical protein